jgi:putative endopeptidase
MKIFHNLIILSLAMIVISCAQGGDGMVEENNAIELENFDNSHKPGDDFYRYVNGTWMKNNPVPDDQSRWSAFNVLNEENQEKIKTILDEAAAKDAEKGTVAQQIGDLYESGMDTNTIDGRGYEPVMPMLAKIDAAEDIAAIQRVAAELTSYGFFPMFYFYSGQDDKNSEMVISNLYQGGMGLPEKSYYFNEDERSVEIREKYTDYIGGLFKLTGENDEAAAAKAAKVMEMETRLANSARTRLELRDPHANYNKMPQAELQTMTPNLNWNTYFTGIGLTEPGDINVGQPDFFKEVDAMLAEMPVEDWKTFLKYKVLTTSSSYLSSDFENHRFDFYGKVMRGSKTQQDRWKRVLGAVNGSLGEAIGQLYVEKYFPPEAKERMDKLVANLRLALEDHIRNLEWMSPETKEKALVKLSTMGVKVGYPEKWKDYSDVNIEPGKYFENVMAASIHEFKENLDKIGKPVDRGEWHMTPQTINAYYSPNMNEIVFPAAILQPPFFDLHADDAVNYGAIGVVIGHEMTHGFDDQGRQFDSEGNLKDWWQPEDAERFTAQVQPLIEQFNSYVAIDSMTVNGELTLGENIADFGGLTVAISALRKANPDLQSPKIDGFTPIQRFFISYAQIWRQNIRDEELIQRLKTDVHSPGEFRVNGGVVNVPEFYEAFEVSADNKMYIEPEERAVIW